jgi:hypothetical protein
MRDDRAIEWLDTNEDPTVYPMFLCSSLHPSTVLSQDFGWIWSI